MFLVRWDDRCVRKSWSCIIHVYLWWWRIGFGQELDLWGGLYDFWRNRICLKYSASTCRNFALNGLLLCFGRFFGGNYTFKKCYCYWSDFFNFVCENRKSGTEFTYAFGPRWEIYIYLKCSNADSDLLSTLYLLHYSELIPKSLLFLKPLYSWLKSVSSWF